MKVRIEFEIKESEDFEIQISDIVHQITWKVRAQSTRERPFTCSYLQAADKILDLDGNTIGTICVFEDRP